MSFVEHAAQKLILLCETIIMSMVRSFSISWKRNRFSLKLFCLSPSGKEHITTLYLTPSSMEHLASSIKKALDKYKSKLPPAEDTKYIG